MAEKGITDTASTNPEESHKKYSELLSKKFEEIRDNIRRIE
jgi:hypothetical protein